MSSSLQPVFLHPGREFSPVPFWFLNGRFNLAELARQLRDFRDHHVYGVILHPRMGFDPSIRYLSEEFFSLMRFITDTARELGMFVFLYDEGMYPSGAACGQVVRENPEYAARGMRCFTGSRVPQGEVFARIGARMLKGIYDPATARLLNADEMPNQDETLIQLTVDFSRGTIRGLLMTEDDGLPDAPPAADLLMPEAVNCFIRLTHEGYYKALGDHFGTTVRAMFTDEPSPTGRNSPPDMKPWTKGLHERWVKEGGSLLELPAVFMDAADGFRIRRKYEDFIARVMLDNYYTPLRTWCESHGIALTGHPAHADQLSLERAFTIPGQDLVWRWVAPGKTATEGEESTQGHCASSAMLHAGKTRCLDECFGCCGPEGSQWGMTAADIRWMSDHLFVRGVNLLCPHAFFYEMDPVVSAQDRPPDVGPNNYFWPYFTQITDYITRMSALGAAAPELADAAVLTDGLHLPWHLTAPLQKKQIPFHYLELADLPKITFADQRACIESQRYRALLIPSGTDVPAEFLRRAEEAGVVLLHDTDTEKLTALGCAPLTFAPASEDMRVSCRKDGDGYLLQVFNEGVTDWTGEIAVPPFCACEMWDAWTGAMLPLSSEDGRALLAIPARQSILLSLQPGEPYPLPPAALSGEQVLELSNQLTLRLPSGETLYPAPLGNWQTIPGLEHYNGALEYACNFTLSAVPTDAEIRLNAVHEMAEISVNGSAWMPLLLPPFAASIAQHLKPGVNSLVIRVTSARVTEYEGKPWFCGLEGPVTLTLREIG